MTDTKLSPWQRLFDLTREPMLETSRFLEAEGYVLVTDSPVESDQAWAWLTERWSRQNRPQNHWKAFREGCGTLGYSVALRVSEAQEGQERGLREPSVAPLIPEARSRMATRGQRVRWKPTAELPGHVQAPAYPGDVGMDLAASVAAVVEPGQITYVPLGVCFAAPAGYWILLLGRSSLASKLGLAMVPGVIDHGYRGEMLAGLYTIGTEPVEVAKGTRLAQAILMPVVEPHPDRVEWLPESERGTNGFGSTGGH